MTYRKTTDEMISLLLEEGEGYSLEFKQGINTDLSKEMVALANASGGRILIGVNDAGKIVGCDTSNKMLSQIQDMASGCDPAVAIEIEKIAEHSILVIHIPEGANRPHRCNKGFYLRNGANSQKMSTADISDLIHAEGRIRFDKQLRLDLDWREVLDENRLVHFLNLSGLQNREDKSALLANLGAGDYKEDRFYLNQTGVLFFAKELTSRLFHASVVCAIFKSAERLYILDRKEFSGSIIENVDDALQYLKQHLNTRFEITGETARRKEILELPGVALREALVNAVTHRDYYEEGANVTVEIFDNRVDIYNPGGLPKGLPLSQFGERSVCRNPLIASLMLRCDYIEKMGTGIHRIKDAVSKAGCPEVKIQTEGIFTITFPRNPEYAPTAETAEIRVTTEVAGQVAGQVARQVAGQVAGQVLQLLQNCPTESTRKELMERLELKGRDNFENKHLKPALDEGLLEMTIPDKPNSRLQKYRLTENGLKAVKNGVQE